MILKIGKGTFNVRLSARLLIAWARWKIWPDYPNLQLLSRTITAHKIHALILPSARAELPSAKASFREGEQCAKVPAVKKP
jgi:hypothetical protein